jgi:hypothetical protein
MGAHLSVPRAMAGWPEPGPRRRPDPFGELVRRVAADPHNPYNVERYLWVLEEPPVADCAVCGRRFDPWFAYDGGAARGLPRRYCSKACANHAAYRRHQDRTHAPVGSTRWGSAA